MFVKESKERNVQAPTYRCSVYQPLRGAQMEQGTETIDAKALQFMKCATTSGCLFLVPF